MHILILSVLFFWLNIQSCICLRLLLGFLTKWLGYFWYFIPFFPNNTLNSLLTFLLCIVTLIVDRAVDIPTVDIVNSIIVMYLELIFYWSFSNRDIFLYYDRLEWGYLQAISMINALRTLIILIIFGRIGFYVNLNLIDFIVQISFRIRVKCRILYCIIIECF